MHKQNCDLKIWASLAALALGTQACTVVTKSDNDGRDAGNDSVGVDGGGSADDSSDDDKTGDAGVDPSPADAGPDTDGGSEGDTDDTDETDETDETDDTETPDAGGGAEGDGGAGGDSGPRSDEYTLAAPDWSCGDRDPGEVEAAPTNITDDTTWSGTVFIKGTVNVRDVELTIEPGTRIIMGPDAALIVGYLGAPTRLHAEGSEDEPIRFCGREDDAGFWEGIVVENNVLSNSRLSHVLIDGAGTDDPALQLNSRILVENVLVQNGDASGVRAVDFDADSTGLFVTNNQGTAVELTSSKAVDRFPQGGDLRGNKTDAVLLDTTNVDTDTTFRDLRVPYLFTGSELRLRDDAEVVFEAGVELAMGVDSLLRVGYLGGATTLKVDGVADNPVTFRAQHDESGFWRGIVLESNVRSNSYMEHVLITGAGGDDQAALDVSATVRLDHLTMEDNDRGLLIENQGVNGESEHWSIRRTSGAPIEAHVNALTTLPDEAHFEDNDSEVVSVFASDLSASGTIENLGIPYRVTKNVRVRDGASIVVEAGVEFHMTADTTFEIGYLGGDAKFVAEGTEEAPIRFIGTDDTAGHWEGILVRSAVRSDSLFDWVEIGHAGQDVKAALVLERPFDVTNTTIFDSASAGIARYADDETNYTESNEFVDNAGDDVVDR